MKVLLVHNRYRSIAPSGEDIVVENEKKLLENRGVEVKTYIRSNDEMSLYSPFDIARVVWGLRGSARSAGELRRIVLDFKPDVAHFHNLFPLVTFSAYAVCAEAGVPVVQTLHNYRLTCASAIHFREEKICFDCKPLSAGRAVTYRCYRGSKVGSFAVARSLDHAWRRDVYRHVSRFITLTPLMRNWLIDHVGISSDRIEIKPNFSALTSDNTESPRERYWIFSGRLAVEKGIKTLLQAWTQLRDVPLVIVGDGPLAAFARRYCLEQRLPVTFTGFLAQPRALDFVRRASGLIFPSEWLESFGMTVLEAWSLRTPVVAARIGGASCLITHGVNGLLYECGNSEDLAKAVRLLQSSPNLVKSITKNASLETQRTYGADANFKRLMGIYNSCLESKAG